MPDPYETYKSETSKYLLLTRPYCYTDPRVMDTPGCGIDIGSQGEPVVPWAMQVDLPYHEFAEYNDNHLPRGPIQIRTDARMLPFTSNSLDFVYSSHLLEDFLIWSPCLIEWTRVLKPGGYLIILIPDKELWAQAIANGQCPNCNHKHEGKVGELSQAILELQFPIDVIEDRLTACHPGDYSILFVGKKKLL